MTARPHPMTPRAARLTLAAVALLAAALWRLELEHHGWQGLTWITAPHHAIPAGALLFALWLWRAAPVRRPALLALASLALTAAAYHIEDTALHLIYNRWPLDRATYAYAYASALAAYLLYPIAHWLIARALGHRLRPRATLAALALYLAAVPLTIILLDLTHHPGSPDLIHAIKSGLVIPPLILALGWPLTPAR
ncbi:MAG: hypothetical protein R3F65_19645 [bacterium]